MKKVKKFGSSGGSNEFCIKYANFYYQNEVTLRKTTYSLLPTITNEQHQWNQVRCHPTNQSVYLCIQNILANPSHSEDRS